MTDERLRAVWDLSVPVVRAEAGRHEYDGHLQDLSADGVRKGLARLPATPGDAPASTDELHLSIAENALRVTFGELEMHRRDPYLHLANLELPNYDRDHSPEEVRRAARHAHLAGWPAAIDVAISTLDLVSAPVARSLLGPAAWLAADVPQAEPALAGPALAAHARLMAYLNRVADGGDPDGRLGAAGLARLMGAAEGVDLDLGRLARDAEAERERLLGLLAEACDRLRPGATPARLLPDLLADHPAPAGVLSETRDLVAETIAFTRAHHLVPDLDGECRVGPTPAARRWVKAMMTWAAPDEPDCPSWYHVTLPEDDWPPERVAEWMTIFSRTVLPAVTVHEVAPGHFAHGRVLRRARTPVRRTLHSVAFMEGWAHYGEEVCLELGFRADDPRFGIGVALEALVRLTRLRCAIGLHTGAIDLAEATRFFVEDAYLAPAVARSEASRGLFDPTYGRYTWGKLVLRAARERARARAGFSLPAFHAELLALGCPPLAVVEHVFG